MFSNEWDLSSVVVAHWQARNVCVLTLVLPREELCRSLLLENRCAFDDEKSSLSSGTDWLKYVLLVLMTVSSTHRHIQMKSVWERDRVRRTAIPFLGLFLPFFSFSSSVRLYCLDLDFFVIFFIGTISTAPICFFLWSIQKIIIRYQAN